jgi:hypothetical protein
MTWGKGREDSQRFESSAVLPNDGYGGAILGPLTPATDSQKQLLGAIAADEGEFSRRGSSCRCSSPIEPTDGGQSQRLAWLPKPAAAKCLPETNPVPISPACQSF